MQDPMTGRLTMIDENVFKKALNINKNVCSVGDVFKIRRCYFEITMINESGISAKGISRKEFFEKRKHYPNS